MDFRCWMFSNDGYSFLVCSFAHTMTKRIDPNRGKKTVKSQGQGVRKMWRLRRKPNTVGESYGDLATSQMVRMRCVVILTQCRCACVARWCEGPSSAAPRGGSSSRKTDLDLKRKKTDMLR